MKMKTVTLTICFLLASIFSLAQEDEIKNNEDYNEDGNLFRIGLHTAPQFYIWNGASIENTNTRYRFAYNQDITLILSAKFGSIFEVKTGLGYSSKNFNREEECLICGTDIVEGSKFRTNYLEIPLLANLYFYNSRLDVYGIVGFKNSFLLSAKNKHQANVNNDIETEFNVKDDFAKYLIGIQAGAGINYNLTYTLSLSAELLYNYNPIKFEPTTGLNFHSFGLNFGINFKL